MNTQIIFGAFVTIAVAVLGAVGKAIANLHTRQGATEGQVNVIDERTKNQQAQVNRLEGEIGGVNTRLDRLIETTTQTKESVARIEGQLSTKP